MSTNPISEELLAARLAEHVKLKWMTPSKIGGQTYQMVPVDLLHEAIGELARRAADSRAYQAVVTEGHQHRVAAWMLECFGPEITLDKVERADRFIEEALELTQATGWTSDRAHALVDYVFGRPVGEIGQEVGGVMVTLAALCNVFDVDMNAEAKREVDRITQPEMVKKIRAKQASKPTGSALPVPVAPPEVKDDGRPALSRAEGQEPVEDGARPPLHELEKAAQLALKALEDWHQVNVAEFTGWGDGEVPPEAEAKLRQVQAAMNTLHAPPSSALVKAPAPAVPDGWKLVPVEPIEAMKAAAFGPVIEGGRGGPITKDFLRQEIGIRTFKAMLAAAPPHPGATHRHKKRGTEYVLLGIGKMQAGSWCDVTINEGGRHLQSVDMRPVAIYQSTDDGSLWARPIEEWEDGRFEVIAAPSQPQAEAE
ncbi:hypothetical protein XM25_00743 [Devosia sp. H5989]|nr:hypothetical protein XM25_00743 [Devosia sp. H5989]